MNHVARFVDTGYFIAIVNRRDGLHRRASQLAAQLGGPFVTTEAVLLEVGNAMARPPLRRLAVALLAEVRSNPSYEIVSLTSELLAQGIEFFAARSDKEWGLVDCISFVVMEDRGIREALSADQHFVQAGFRALLRE
jgi:predicted nucleic acid-binding protein